MTKKMQSLEARMKFYDQITQNELSLAETVKAMRAIADMTQPEYAKFVGVAPRIIIDIERGVANPTLETLRKIGKPFALEIFYFRAKKESKNLL